MNKIVPFDFEHQEIRVLVENDGPWWVLTDVCRALGISNPSDAAGRLEEDERKALPRATLGLTDGGAPMILVNEPGLYRFIMRSDKPEAKRFQRWVFHEVLPAIRKTGSFVAKSDPTNFDAIRALVDAAEVHEARLKKVETAVENFGAHEDYRSIKAHAALIGVKLKDGDAKSLGMQATALSKRMKHPIGTQPDATYGKVNMYHRDVLEQLFKA